MRPANRAERTLDASARGRAMRLAAPTDVRHSLPRSRRFRCLCTRSDIVVSSKNLSKRRRPTPRYRYFQIDTKNGRLTPIRIVLARNILRAHPTLVPKRGCVSAPAMDPLWSGLFSVAPCGERLSEHCARPATAESPVAGQRVQPGSRASSHARRPTSRASHKIPPHEPRTVTASQSLSGSCAPLHYQKLSRNPWRSSTPPKHGLIGHAHPRRPRAALLT